MTEHANTKLRFFGRRQGRKLRAGRASLIEQRLPALTVPLEAGKPLDPWALFAKRPERLWLEIGFGAGEHPSWQAEHHPDVGIIASEVFVNGVASLLRHIEVPTLMINARNDPFLPAHTLPRPHEVSGRVTLDFPESGGHAGFITGRFPGSTDWLPRRMLHYFAGN